MSYFSNFKNVEYDLNADGISDTLVNLTNITSISKTLIDNIGFYSYVNVLDGERPEQFSYRLYEATGYYWTFLLTNPSIKNIWNDWPMAASQLQEYCEKKYGGTAALCDNWHSATVNVLVDKFKIGDVVTGVLSSAFGTITEIHTNNGYIVMDNVVGTFAAGGEDLIRAENITLSIPVATISTTAIVNKAYAPKHFIDDVTLDITTKKYSGVTPYTNFDYEIAINDKNRNLKVIKPTMIETVVDEFRREIAK